MLCVSNMFGVVVSAILLSTLNEVTHGLYVPHPELQRAIVHKKVIATWDEAKLRCENEGAMLASPVDNNLLEYMKSSIGVNNHTTPYFIGMRLIDNPEHTVIVSLEGIALDDLPQAVLDMIEQIDPQDGDCLRMDSHDIRTGPCQNRLPYICYKNGTASTTTTSSTTSTSTTTTTSTTTSAPPTTTEVTTTVIAEVNTEVTTTETSGGCTSGGYTKLSSGYYKVHLDSKLWDEANSTCTSEGGYLVVLNDEEEARAVKEYAFHETSSLYMLIGILDRGGWHSVRGDSLDQIYHYWADSRSNYPEGCGSLKYTGLLDDMRCSYQHPFVCEKSCAN